MKLTPRHDQVHIRRDASPSHMGTIEIPVEHRIPPHTGTVLALGEGVTDLRVGDHVLFSEVAGTEMLVLGQSVLLMREEDVLAVITPEVPNAEA